MDRRGSRCHGVVSYALAFAAVIAASSSAVASTITQNVSWTIDRSGTSTKYRVVAYGDSIYAGYEGGLFDVAVWSAPNVQGDYASNYWGTDVEVVRRCKSGAKADDIYNNKIVGEKSYMQSTNTRIVTFEMCGNDFLQARSSFAGQTGTCNYGVLSTALTNCSTYQQNAMSFINANAYSGTKLKVIANIYYPGYNADNKLSSCTDSGTGQKVNLRDKFLPYLAKSNWRACNYANTYGFKCADTFANFMGADYDSNGDGQVDSDALKYVQGETESAYVTRITVTLKSTLRDANTHFATASTSYDYIQSDDTHPTYDGGIVGLSLFGNGSGSAPPDFTPSQFVNGKNPVWNQFGHERMGWGLSTYNPATP
ncbi:MAG: SGNH/GDSL hydrolase family protein [Deltaproteobacteria bacterium]|nr:SGNH/GDSL hydrolase family protein [Deltaproteobacteria bacterium]MBI3391509.1 SGNH/GDSL hydrolase family protein [Deltaproteobacteria bacterium]